MLFSYDVEIAQVIDVFAAIYLSVVGKHASGPGTEVSLSTGDIARTAGLSVDQARATREKLEARGVLQLTGTEGRSVRQRIVVDVLDRMVSAFRAQAVAIATAKKVKTPTRIAAVERIAERRDELALPILIPPRLVEEGDILIGRYDGRDPKRYMDDEPLLQGILNAWGRVWRRESSSPVMLTKERREALRRALVVESRQPSDLVRAIHGMREDEWAERVDHCDLNYVVRQLDRWVDLYEQVTSGRRKARGALVGTATKVMHGVTIPADYVWTQADDAAVGAGLLFDASARRWVSHA